MPYLVSPVHYMHVNPLLSLVIVTVTGSRKNSVKQVYGVVPKGLLTFLGSLYKEVAKTTSGTLVYRFERQTARIFSFLPKNIEPSY